MIQNVLQIIEKLLHSNRGATAIEYALIAALISVFIIGGVLSAGDGVNALYTALADAYRDATSGS